MISANFTINGKPFTENSLKEEIDNVILRATIEKLTKRIESALTSEEVQRITLNFEGGIKDLSLNISGDGEVVKKVRQALGID